MGRIVIHVTSEQLRGYLKDHPDGIPLPTDFLRYIGVEIAFPDSEKLYDKNWTDEENLFGLERLTKIALERSDGYVNNTEDTP